MRKPEQKEIELIKTLLNKSGKQNLLSSLDTLQVESMKDGIMGSLLLFPENVNSQARTFGEEIITAAFDDNDGTLVSIALNVDKAGNLFELDMWKVDFSPLNELPTIAKIRFANPS